MLFPSQNTPEPGHALWAATAGKDKGRTCRGPKPTLRLAILQQSYGRFGGAERLALSHFLQLRKMNVDVTLYYQGAISPGWAKRLDGHEIRPIPNGVAGNLSELTALSKFLKELGDFDRIIIHHHVEPVLALYLSKLLGDKIIWYSGSVFELAWEKFITGLDYRSISPTVRKTSAGFYGGTLSTLLLSNPFFDFAVPIARAVDISTVRGYRRILANSSFLSRFLARAYKLKDNPRVVYPGPDPILEQLSTQIISNEQDFMLAVGALIPLKNVEGIIQAAATVPSAKVVIVGDGQERNKLKELATRLAVPLEMRGSSIDELVLAKIYSECKFLVHLSLYEPFGLTPLEAGLFSKPSIVTNRGGPPEIVVDGETGYVVDPRDFKHVSSRMNELLVNSSLRRHMGAKARRKVLERFTLEKSAKTLLAEVED